MKKQKPRLVFNLLIETNDKREGAILELDQQSPILIVNDPKTIQFPSAVLYVTNIRIKTQF